MRDRPSRRAADHEGNAASEHLAEVSAREVIRSIGQAVYRWDIETDRLDWSSDAAGLLNVTEPIMLETGRDFARLVRADATSTRDKTIRSGLATAEGTPYTIEYALSSDRLDANEDLWLEDSGRWFAGPNGAPCRAEGLVRIVTERRRQEERAGRLSRLDPVTGCLNRAALDAAISEVLDDRERVKRTAFVVVSMERVDLVNSVYGYEAGDAVIATCVDRLRTVVRGDDMIARFSGAKFAVLLKDCGPTDLGTAARRFLTALQAQVETEAGPVEPDIAVVGVHLAPPPGGMAARRFDSPRALYTAAYRTLDETRETSGNQVALHAEDPKRDEAFREAVGTADTVMRAMRDGRLRLAWQPVVDAGTHATVFHEALLRLETDEGVWSAGRFIETVSRLNLVRRVDRYALDAACDLLETRPDARFAINISNDTALDPSWLSRLARTIRGKPQLGERLIVEITESHAAQSVRESRHFIACLHDMGAKVALDDFGAGFTAFRNLAELDLDIIKIDGRFSADLGTNAANREFIRSLVRLANLFDATTVVEWVEDFETAETLYEWGVDLLQGFYFGAPTIELPWE